MARINKFQVVPYLPEKLKPLSRIAMNLWWVWNFEAIELFRRLDVDLWRECGHNPVRLLGAVSQAQLDEAAESESFLAHMEKVDSELSRHLEIKSWFEENFDSLGHNSIAYFSAEFGIHECLPIYSGGLGVLAGDHLKSSSELGVPLCGVGLLYRFGYFHQYLNMDGWQQERFPEVDFYNSPLTSVVNENGENVVVAVDFPGRDVFAKVWLVKIGRIKLYLLDTNIDLNSAEDRTITDGLYGGDIEMRIKQEMLLGIGGVRALKALGEDISVFHMNEGHAAFLSIERIREIMKSNSISFREAFEFVTSTNVFTTHTPVPAGNDRFDPTMVTGYFSHIFGEMGLSAEEFLALGREDPADRKETFCMTVLALKTAAGCNGVSKLHGHVSRNMWKNIWKGIPEHEVPIGHITNGIQTLSWTSDEMMRLFNRYLGPRWIESPADTGIWARIDSIPDFELWRCRERSRERLVSFARKKLKEQLLARGATVKEAERSSSVLDPDALTIGFARRFATYKRANLLFRDLARLDAILNDRDMPVQIIFAGKAHPRDNMGKELIRQVIHLCGDDRFRNRVVFLEDYDINIARYMVQGVDIWLNNPIRPKEASGTSGMKVIPNGGLNISVLDGWWDEAYEPDMGWAIGKGEVYDDHNYQDEVESLSVYNLLENDVKPLFYSRRGDGLPCDWLNRMRASMRKLIPVFNTNRMVKSYVEDYYMTALSNHGTFSANRHELARDVCSWKKKTAAVWEKVSVREISSDLQKEAVVGSKVKVRAIVRPGDLSPEDLLVELYFGSVNGFDTIVDGVAVPMMYAGTDGRGNYEYEGSMLCLQSGQFAFTVRVLPHRDGLSRKYDPDFSVNWA